MGRLACVVVFVIAKFTAVSGASDMPVPPGKKQRIDAPVAPRFRSPLGDDLPPLVLQYAMYRSRAREMSDLDPYIHSLVKDTLHRFPEHPPGVQVTGAGAAQRNGFYQRQG